MSKARVKIKDTDKGYRDLVKRVFSGGPVARIEVGIFANDGAKAYVPKDDRNGAPQEPLTVLQVGIFNEFGLGVPERSFIRAYFDEHGATHREEAKKLMQAVVKGTRTRDQIVEILGQRMVAGIQQRIAAGISPGNAESTIAAKGSSTPLIETGQLRSSISYRVVAGG